MGFKMLLEKWFLRIKTQLKIKNVNFSDHSKDNEFLVAYKLELM